MTIELQLQSKCVSAVRDMGGFAQKCSHRFLIGVPDLLFQLPNLPTSYWEVKVGPDHRFAERLQPTTKQKMWLRDFTQAGGYCGVIYFTLGDELKFAMYPTKTFDWGDVEAKWTGFRGDYRALPRGSKFEAFKGRLNLLLMARRGEENRGSVY